MMSLLFSVLMLADLRTVPQVDLRKYSGAWYEIARLPNRFQAFCAGDVRAEYTLNADKTILVVNSCRPKDKAEPKTARGLARVSKEDKGGNAVLEVRFAPAFLSFLSAVWGDYRIIELDGEYRYAVVGSKDRKYLWVLSRSKTLSEDVYRKLLASAAAQGFNTSAVVRTTQN
jgi:apolipoprotein D and lipocalin family protein